MRAGRTMSSFQNYTDLLSNPSWIMSSSLHQHRYANCSNLSHRQQPEEQQRRQVVGIHRRTTAGDKRVQQHEEARQNVKIVSVGGQTTIRYTKLLTNLCTPITSACTWWMEEGKESTHSFHSPRQTVTLKCTEGRIGDTLNINSETLLAMSLFDSVCLSPTPSSHSPGSHTLCRDGWMDGYKITLFGAGRRKIQNCTNMRFYMWLLWEFPRRIVGGL